MNGEGRKARKFFKQCYNTLLYSSCFFSKLFFKIIKSLNKNEKKEMDEWILQDRQADRRKGEQMNTQIDSCVDRQTDRQTDRQINRQIDRQMDR